jgi:hypothetical protein
LSTAFALLFLTPTLVLSAVPTPKDKTPTISDGDVRVLATCNDGTEWRSRHAAHKGACSGHGGVKAWADGSPIRGRAVPLNPPRK